MEIREDQQRNIKNNVVKSSVIVMAVLLCSKILGFLRQTVIAGVFGADFVTDIYFTSNDFMIGVSGAFSVTFTTALVSHYIKLKVQKGSGDADRTASRVLVLFSLIGLAVFGLLVLCAPGLARILGSQFNGAQLVSLTHYLRIFALAFFFSSVEAILAGILNANNIFAPTKMYGLFLNPIAILLMLCFAGSLGINALVVAFVAANLIYILFLILCVLRVFDFKPGRRLWDVDVKQVFIIALPLLLANIFMQFNNVIDKIICNLLGEGMVSTYSYGYTLEQFVTAVLTASVSTVLYSRFSTLVAEKDSKGMVNTLKRSLAVLLIILIPVALIVIVAADDIVSIVYLHGKFTREDAELTRMALIGFAVGFPLVAMREMLIRAHFSYEDSKMPMIGNCVAVGLNAFFSILLARIFVSFDIPGVFGVALATSLAALFPVFFLNSTVKKHLPEFSLRQLMPFLLKAACAAVGCVIAVLALHTIGMGALPRFVLESIGGFGAFILILVLLRSKEMLEIIGIIRQKLGIRC